MAVTISPRVLMVTDTLPLYNVRRVRAAKSDALELLMGAYRQHTTQRRIVQCAWLNP